MSHPKNFPHFSRLPKRCVTNSLTEQHGMALRNSVRDYSTLREKRSNKVKQSEVKRSLNGNKADAKTRYS